ncbi:STAS domain-containing protein [Cellulomonas hominis]|uniref:Anti-sigma factor antagonist n=1 Tax=Cellulomonas hominis TaxID=156981 RepID=A0A7Z8NQQ6_9CELL|nr:STAS domain-containing protein [Cellulomonas hominis]
MLPDSPVRRRARREGRAHDAVIGRGGDDAAPLGPAAPGSARRHDARAGPDRPGPLTRPVRGRRPRLDPDRPGRHRGPALPGAAQRARLAHAARGDHRAAPGRRRAPGGRRLADGPGRGRPAAARGAGPPRGVTSPGPRARVVAPGRGRRARPRVPRVGATGGARRRGAAEGADVEIAVQRIGGPVVVLRPRGRLTAGDAPELRAVVADLVEQGRTKLVVDLEETTFLDSSGLGALIAGLRATRTAGGDLTIARPTGQVLDVLTLTTMIRVLPPHETVADAFAALA